ncbi:RAMP superfamily CRISPR-associated protein [Geitlerinema sp. PCC 9228]|uniref:RAMP superfamily CRISPR-associated protein n=1 Tax=Geitlerinema sp. PCC 9228 TaxID=111611 RepID=UPI001479866E|nr:RAMP superfamily CRISPR-associated protein [Geitlerinema sp. PCC 9228]
MLTARSSIHVGGAEDNSLVDLALAKNGLGKYYIPGTSLAGAFRGWMKEMDQYSGSQDTERLWGYSEKPAGQDSNEGHASFSIVEDAPIKLPNGKDIEVRDGVGIDREWGSAADYSKYDRAILPCGTEIPLELTIDCDRSFDFSKIYDLLDVLCAGKIRIGAAKTRGLGKIQLCGCKYWEQTLSDRQSMILALKDSLPNGKNRYKNYSPKAPKLLPKLTVEIQWQPIEPVMVKAEREGIAVDILPLVSSIKENMALVLPGSSIKGALRTQAERIVRTVGNMPMPPHQGQSYDKFLQQLQSVSLTEKLFGSAAKKNDPDSKLGLGALSVDDCYSNLNQNISLQKWQDIEQAKDEKKLRKALDRSELLKDTQQAYHVAVDRWTGGAADGFLYSNLEPFNVQWEPICLTVNFNRLSCCFFEEEKDAAIALFLLTLRDLYRGSIPLGYGVNRGLGSIEVRSISLKGENLPSGFENLDNVCLAFSPLGGVENLEAGLLERLNQSWQQWIQKQRQAQETN